MPKTNTNTAIECQPAARVPQNQGEQPQVKTGSVTYLPALDMYDLGDRYELHIDLPGTSSDAVNLTIDDSILTIEATVPWRYPDSARPIHGEFGIGNFRRELRLGEDIDSEALSASYESGVLSVTLPKRPERRLRKIEVKGG